MIPELILAVVLGVVFAFVLYKLLVWYKEKRLISRAHKKIEEQDLTVIMDGKKMKLESKEGIISLKESKKNIPTKSQIVTRPNKKTEKNKRYKKNKGRKKR